MLDEETAEITESPATTPNDTPGEQADTPTAAESAKKTAAKRTTAKKAPAKKAATKKTAAKRTTKKAATAEPGAEPPATPAVEPAGAEAPPADVVAETGEGAPSAEAAAPAKKAAKKTTGKKTAAKRTTKKVATASVLEETTSETDQAPAASAGEPVEAAGKAAEAPSGGAVEEASPTPAVPATALLFQPPDPTKAVVTRRRRSTKAAEAEGADAAAKTSDESGEEGEKPTDKPAKKATNKATKKPAQGKPRQDAKAPEAEATPEAATEAKEASPGEGEDEQGGERRRRRRGGRRRRRSGGGDEPEGSESSESSESEKATEADKSDSDEGDEQSSGSRRRRRRRRSGEGADGDEAEGRVRKARNAEDEITALSGSTRLEAKKQRRREGREAGRRRAPIVSEAEFLARRESVDRVMVIRQRQDLTQIAVLEDKVLVEHYVSRESQTSLIGNVYLGRVQNVLPSMEAAFIDIGKGRNAVLYAGEVNWDALGAKNGQPRKIEAVLKSGQPILVQVTKDPVGHKGARLTSQISLPGRFLVYVPDGTTSGISRKLPDTERNRLKSLLKEIVPETAGVIVRTAAEGASEEELTRDVERLTARWEDIEKKSSNGNAPQLLYGEPDLTLKVVRDLFTEDFSKLVIAGGDAWDMVEGYVSHVAPDLQDRLEKYDGERDVFAEYRIDEQIEKALDRKVWLPSGGSLVIDRTEAMTVVDVNTGKFTGSGGNLEETVTKNNLEAAEEIVRQLRLRDIGGIIVVDFIDMVLESNRDLVLRRLVECLGRDRTRHQVAEVTSLGLVQMTRKRIGTGLLEAFSEACEHCQGRGLVLHHEPVEPKKKSEDESRRGRRGGRGRGRDDSTSGNGGGMPSPKDVAAMAKHEAAEAKSEDGSESTPEAVAEPSSGKPAKQEPAELKAEAPAEPLKGARTPAGEAEAASRDTGEAEAKPGRSRGGRGRGRGRAAKDAAEAPTTEQNEQNEQSDKPQQPEQPERSEKPGTGEDRQRGEKPSPATSEPAAEGRTEDAAAEHKGADESPVEAASAEPAAPAAPKIVTSVRRRSARRAAGPPPETAAPVASASSSSTIGEASDHAPGAGSTGPANGDQASDEPADAEPLATLLDAAEVSPDGQPEEAEGTEGAAHDAPATPHVPVKKRGSRRR
ncbi:MAG TPA: Rne/Rng family ribonuclease [Nocardioidaceae bacterium]|nr:Rne/Rng family ribonuclease [Nocardioidaceae bacterium]